MHLCKCLDHLRRLTLKRHSQVAPPGWPMRSFCLRRSAGMHWKGTLPITCAAQARAMEPVPVKAWWMRPGVLMRASRSIAWHRHPRHPSKLASASTSSELLVR